MVLPVRLLQNVLLQNIILLQKVIKNRLYVTDGTVPAPPQPLK